MAFPPGTSGPSGASLNSGSLPVVGGMPWRTTSTPGPQTTTTQGGFDDVALLDFFTKFKRECFDQRWIFERQYIRNIYYVLLRCWIQYNSRMGEWTDKRMAKWIPRPVNHDLKIGVQTIRAMLTATKPGVDVRPNGHAPENVTAAATADELAPLLHEEHQMDLVLKDFDYWYVVCGNAFLYEFWDQDPKYGTITITQETCVACGTVTSSDQLTGAQPTCPNCQGHAFTPALGPDGEAIAEKKPIGRGATRALSPLELAFPPTYARFDDVPGVILLRWRARSYYENSASLSKIMAGYPWQKTPNDRTMQIFKALPLQNDLGMTPFGWSGTSSSTEEEGTTEYELWYKPCDAYPQGLVMRVAGDASPKILHIEEEALPGPIPYLDAAGDPLWPFQHAAYDSVGGRVLGSGAIDPVIDKYNSLNQLDSMFLMITNRVANPYWVVTKGTEIEKLTGEPGLVVKWDSLTAGGQGKPERVPGTMPGAELFTLRELYKKDIQDGMGTQDILNGAKPADVSAFSAMQFMAEQAEGRFASVRENRGNAYKDWFRVALELERSWGPAERTKAILTSARGYTFKNFQKTQLRGSITIVVEAGSNKPKSALGRRASIEHASQLKILNPQNPETQQAILASFGLSDLMPGLESNVQAALEKQQEFEDWMADPKKVQQSMIELQQATQQFQQQAQQALQQHSQQSMQLPPGQPVPPVDLPPPPSPLMFTPLKWRPWYNAPIHLQEFLKWANSDRIRELLRAKPQAEKLLEQHLTEMQQAAGQHGGGKPPATSIAFKDLPPDGKTQLASQAGINLSPEDAAAASLPKPPLQPPKIGGSAMTMANSNRNATSTGIIPHGVGQGAQNAGPR